jgi:hypothetical protein
MECHRVTPSGRIRSPEEVKKALIRLQKADRDAGNPEKMREMHGFEYAQRDDEKLF